MIALSNTEITKAYLGNAEIAKIYLGEDLVFGGSPTPAVPYDAQVEYLQSSGNQYINSGIECTSDLSVKFKAYWSTNVNAAFCGGISQLSGNNYFRHHCSPYGQNFYWIQASGSNASVRKTSSLNTWHEIELDATNGTCAINNSVITFTPISTLVSTGANYGIFARIGGGGIALQYRACRIAYFQILRNGVLLRDFIPVRNNGIGYMYDKVSGELFSNSGSGSFTYGNDVTI